MKKILKFLILIFILILIILFLKPINTINSIGEISLLNKNININNLSKIDFNFNTPEIIAYHKQLIEEKEKKEEQDRINKQIEIAKQEAEQQRINEEKKLLVAQQITKTVELNVTSRSEESREVDSNDYIAFTATGYCPCALCCGKSNGITAVGTKAMAGRTIAASSSYAFGTKFEIKGMGTYTVEDRGGAIQGNKIDIYFSTHQEALSFGRKTVYCKILN